MLPSGLPEEVADEEVLSRFARHHSKYFKSTPHRPKGDLFMPPKNSAVLSVSRITGMGSKVVRELGENVVSKAGDKLYGWAALDVGAVRALHSFKVVSDEPDNEHHCHAHIEGFPIKLPATAPSEKSELKQACDDLAELASDMVLVELLT